MNKFLMVAVLSLAGCGWTHVDAGFVGVKVDQCSGKGVEGAVAEVGYHSTGPCLTIVEYPTFQQTMVLTKLNTEGSPGDDSITITSSEGLAINMDVSMSFTVEPTKVPTIYSKYRKDLQHIESTFFRQSIREALQETCAKYTAQQLYSDKRESSRQEVQVLLTRKFVDDGFNITQFTINETRVPHEVEDAIKAKVAMIQQAQQAQQAVFKSEAEGKQRVVNAEADAAVTKTRAEAEAASVKMRADAESYSNQKMIQSISPTLVEYLKVQKWNGQMPQVTGGGTNIISLSPNGNNTPK